MLLDFDRLSLYPTDEFLRSSTHQTAVPPVEAAESQLRRNSLVFTWCSDHAFLWFACGRQFLESNKEGNSEHCTFGIVSHNSNSSTLLMSRIIFFDISLNGL